MLVAGADLRLSATIQRFHVHLHGASACALTNTEPPSAYAPLRHVLSLLQGRLCVGPLSKASQPLHSSSEVKGHPIGALTIHAHCPPLMGLLGLGVQSCARLPDGAPRTGRVMLCSVKELCTVCGADGCITPNGDRSCQHRSVIDAA